MDVDRLRLAAQAAIAGAVIIGATYLGVANVLDSEAIAVLYGAALGAVGAGAVGGSRAPAHTTSTVTHVGNGEHGTDTTDTRTTGGR